MASSCKAAVQILDKRDTKDAKRASSPLFNLASQLLAAKLNLVGALLPAHWPMRPSTTEPRC